MDSWNFRWEKASSGQMALGKVSETDFDLVLLDVNMPDMDGISVLKEIHLINEETQVVMISGLSQIENVRSALRDGAYDYLVKPWDIDDLELTIRRALAYQHLLVEKKEYQINLEREVKKKTEELSTALTRINNTYNETILALGSALETRDSETKEHCLRVAHYSRILAKRIGITDNHFLLNLERGAYLHDIGKIGVPDHILRKRSSLTEEEWVIMKKHPEIGKSIVEGIAFLHDTVPVIYYHHEQYNGTGYPQGLKREDIPQEARIFMVADALDAITSERCYQHAVSFKKAKAIIRGESGKQFSPEIVEALSSLTEREIMQREVSHVR
jgi:putative nucleotidyltransferase with HDIG domain